MAAVVDVNDAPGQGCKCTKDQLPVVTLIINGVACILLSVFAVLDVLTFASVPSVILDIYIVVLCFLALSAEARMLKPLRSLIYNWMKYTYFLTSYIGRGLFYIFLGTISISDTIQSYAVGGFAMFAGVFLIIVDCRFKMPIYMDWQVVKEEAAAKANKAAEQAFRTPGAASTPTPSGSDSGSGGYVPPAGHVI